MAAPRPFYTSDIQILRPSTDQMENTAWTRRESAALKPRAARRAPSAFPFRAASRASRAPVVVVYHDLSGVSSPLTAGLGVTTQPEVFRRHVRYFAQNFDLITAADLAAGTLPPRPLLITFDDVYRSVIDVAAPILREAGAPAIWFLNPQSVDAETIPLDNLLSWAAAEFGLAAVAELLGAKGHTGHGISFLIANYLPRLHYRQVSEIRLSLCTMLGVSEQAFRRESKLFVTAAEIPTLREYGIDVGNHSLSHRFFRGLTPDELTLEIAQSRDMLERISGQRVSQLAVPYGNAADLTRNALAAARASGHEAIFLVHARHNGFRPAQDIYYRIDAGTASPASLGSAVNVLPLMRSAWSMLRPSRAWQPG
jgi:peptidoglycan/xylan/chitin deacetylase (PgdA/CDA1 family)